MSYFKAKMHQIRFRLGLRPRPHWRSSQHSPRPSSWVQGVLLLREGKGKGEGKGRGPTSKGREEKGKGKGEGKREGEGTGRERVGEGCVMAVGGMDAHGDKSQEYISQFTRQCESFVRTTSKVNGKCHISGSASTENLGSIFKQIYTVD